MGRNRSHTRRTAHTYPRGVLDVRVEGYGFVSTSEGVFFIPESKMGGAFDGDLVEVSRLPRAGAKKRRATAPDGDLESMICSQDAPAARVVRVVERCFDTLVGRYEVAEPFGVVVPEDTRLRHDIFTMRADFPDVPDGSLVRVRITTFPGKGTAATGVIEEVFADSDDSAVLQDLIVARHKLSTKFSDAALEEADRATLDVAKALRNGYADLRERFVFTVDPVDARDFDDAVSLEPVGRYESPDSARGKAPDVHAPAAVKWRLGVHIADVSAYVPWDSALDLEARRRGTSVYLADRVLPMLPERLSNDLCSLRPGEDRLCMTVDLFLDERGNLVDTQAYPAVIRSAARLTYDQAQKLLDRSIDDDEGAVDGVDENVAESLRIRLRGISAFAKQRIARRRSRGGIEIDAPEAKVRLGFAGEPIAIDLREKTEATSLIEESMILANEAVAQLLSESDSPCIYRVHEAPDAASLEALVPLFEEFPWFDCIDKTRLVRGDAHQLAACVDEARGRLESQLVSNVVLKSMKKAVYRDQNVGHYGLASDAYAHFTSPIRRYPDLVVHRMLKAHAAHLQGKSTPHYAAQKEALRGIAEHSSEMERVAQSAARESQECKMVEYLAPYVGTEFSALVSGVATYGLYVRLENTAWGLLPLRRLGREYFSYDDEHQKLIGQETGVVYRLGQPLRVVLIGADPRTRTLDFRLADSPMK